MEIICKCERVSFCEAHKMPLFLCVKVFKVANVLFTTMMIYIAIIEVYYMTLSNFHICT